MIDLPDYCLFNESCKNMDGVEDGSIDLAVTSPPYAVGKDYEEELTLNGWRKLMRAFLKETRKKLARHGRLCVNLANCGRAPHIPLQAYLIMMAEKADYALEGTIIWDKSASAGASTAWGSFGLPSAPCLRDTVEYIVVLQKERGTMKREGGESTISKEDFTRDTLATWTMQTESAKQVGHPAPFPLDLPRRLINLYSWSNSTILDCFAGSGTTLMAAMECGRQSVGYELDEGYHRLARRRIENWRMHLSSRLPL